MSLKPPPGSFFSAEQVSAVNKFMEQEKKNAKFMTETKKKKK